MTTAALSGPSAAVGPAQSDEALADAVRAGDTGAFAVLYDRHLAACLRFARYLGAQPEIAQDVVAESFTRVFVQLVRGRGPTAAFRSYVFSAVRANLCNAVHRDHRQDLAEDPADHVHSEDVDEPVGELLESMMLARAFATLPRRWQNVLWQVEVEGRTAASLAQPLGMTANAVAALTYRAREGLRAAYLQAHLHENGDPACAAYVPKLSPWLRRRLPAAEHRVVEAHVRGCPRCSTAVAELADLAATLNRAAHASGRPGRRGRHGSPVAGGAAVLVLLVIVTALATMRPSRGPDLPDGRLGPAGSGGRAVTATVGDPSPVDRPPAGSTTAPEASTPDPVERSAEPLLPPTPAPPRTSFAATTPEVEAPTPPVDEPEPSEAHIDPTRQPLPPSPSDTPTSGTVEPPEQEHGTCQTPATSPHGQPVDGGGEPAPRPADGDSPGPESAAPECPQQAEEVTGTPDPTPVG
ncbi:sigma-70 family RNA polymerase sigma factor [Saccharothrix sp. NPDC042600]|uniref:sigma-70 family RNA polymerase sigma factor n=1 Tax=Saccharothrix TaxID=2071 RepID=UPI0033EC8CD6|nr:hypothetical protein GCM10017745_49710 [Saccharothrix mutabilis subsp. capreolus]